jgi:predicted CXXCH cytochrome family protein
MKFLYIIENTSQPGFHDQLKTEIEKDEILIGRGSGSDIHLVSRMVSFRHALITLRDETLYVENLEPLHHSVKVNHRTIKKASLKAGDVLIIGDIRLEVISRAGVWGLLEKRQGPDADEESRLGKAVNRLTLSKRFPSIFMISMIFAASILFLFLYEPLSGNNPTVWMTGPLAEAHRNLEEDCQACHVQAFERVVGHACSQCHAYQKHAAGLPLVFGKSADSRIHCLTCHREHTEKRNIVSRNPSLCLDCHRNIREVAPGSSLVSIRGFDETHPELTLLAQGGKDPSNIKFNHKIHLEKVTVRVPGTGEERSMDCNDCHSPVPPGNYMERIEYNNGCILCHPLAIVTPSQTMEIPHASPAIIRALLKSPDEFFNYPSHQTGENAKFLQTNAGDESDTVKSKIPNKKQWLENYNSWVRQAGGRSKIETQIFYKEKGGCIQCHYLDFDPADSAKPVMGQVNRDQRSSDRKLPQVRRPEILRKFLSAAQFNHKKHDSLGCELCHIDALDSEKASDLLLPSIQVCSSCHANPESHLSDCIQCHLFHAPSGAIQ